MHADLPPPTRDELADSHPPVEDGQLIGLYRPAVRSRCQTAGCALDYQHANACRDEWGQVLGPCTLAGRCVLADGHQGSCYREDGKRIMTDAERRSRKRHPNSSGKAQ